MLTIFSTPKPFRGHFGVIQRNALTSWTHLHPDIDVILFGQEDGAAEVARELGIRHEAFVERNQFGTNRLDYMFRRAQEMARHRTLCYSNCDIIFTGDFCRAAGIVSAKFNDFLMVGRRWDTPITEPLNYSEKDWTSEVRRMALSARNQRENWWIDYFCFTQGFCKKDMPPFAVGRVRWDNWMIWKALESGLPVVDASPSVIAIHQNHDYSHLARGRHAVWEGDEAKQNLELAGGCTHQRTILDATYELRGSGRIRRRTSFYRRRFELERHAAILASRVWYAFLNFTYKPRHAIGLRRMATEKSRRSE